MGKQGTPKSPQPDSTNTKQSFGKKEYQLRCSDASLGGYDPSLGRRVFLGGEYQFCKPVLPHGLNSDNGKNNSYKGVYGGGKKHFWFHKHLRPLAFTIGLVGLLFLLDSVVFSLSDFTHVQNRSALGPSLFEQYDRGVDEKNETSAVLMYARLVNLASTSLIEREFRPERSTLWREPNSRASAWKPCANQISEFQEKSKASNGFILVSANGGINQQRVAVCNAVAVAALLNATLVIPRFLYSSVWKDPSQFGDIYQEDYFISMLKNEVTIVTELPPHVRSVNLEAVGSVITDAELVKEAKPNDYIRLVLPVLQRNGVVHLLGYGNRLGFDPLPSQIQKLRCKCNFHALKFVPRIQEVGSLLLRRIRKYKFSRNMLDKQLLGNYIQDSHSRGAHGPSKYLALHLRFEEDMVAYSFCEFGGGETEKKELQSYRETHFPLVLERLKNSKPINPSELRLAGRCPLTPEEASLVLSALGFKHGTYIYLAGSQIYGGQSRMSPFTGLYPNLVTKEDLLSPTELDPFRNFSSQLAALDFIACTASDVFAMTDTGSQLSSMVAGFRTYFGGGNAPTLRPNRKRLAMVLLENSTIGWNSFEARVRRMFDEGQRLQVRSSGQSIYRQPRTRECMCKSN